MYKYNFHYLLRQLSVEDYKISWVFLPQALNISKHTWKTWIYTKKEDSRNIPICALHKIATFFECSIDDLYNTENNQSDLKKSFEDFKTN